jgi:hypothetical protein
MDKAPGDECNILTEARRLKSLERTDQIRHTDLERSGGITIIPKNKSK